jgi:hypothetical protein
MKSDKQSTNIYKFHIVAGDLTHSMIQFTFLILSVLEQEVNYHPSISSLFPCTDYMLLPITVAAPLGHWDHGIESHLRHGYLCAFILCLCCSVCR